MKDKSNIILLLLLTAFLVFTSAACGRKATSWDPGAPSAGNKTGESSAQSDASDAGDEAEKKDEDGGDSGTTDDTPEDNKDKTPEDNTAGDEKTSASSLDTGRSFSRIEIYTIDDVTLETVSITAMVDVKDGLTVDAVVNAVLLALEDHSVSVDVAGITTEGSGVTIDIAAEDAIKPFGDAGSSVEEVVLDCISYSIFDNFKDLKKIYFTVNGGGYESGHISLPMGEPYLTVE